MKFKNLNRNNIYTDLIVMNIIKRKINQHYQLSYNDEELIKIIFKDYALLLKEVLKDELY